MEKYTPLHSSQSELSICTLLQYFPYMETLFYIIQITGPVVNIVIDVNPFLFSLIIEVLINAFCHRFYYSFKLVVTMWLRLASHHAVTTSTNNSSSPSSWLSLTGEFQREIEKGQLTTITIYLAYRNRMHIDHFITDNFWPHQSSPGRVLNCKLKNTLHLPLLKFPYHDMGTINLLPSKFLKSSYAWYQTEFYGVKVWVDPPLWPTWRPL